MEWMLMPLKRYADFSGRSRRKEYWMYYLFVMIVYVVLSMLAGFGAPSIDPATGEVTGGAFAGIIGIVLMLFWLGILIPTIAVAVRRCHDQDKSGWFVLVPIYGFILMFLEGTKGPNRFGEDPKGNTAETFS